MTPAAALAPLADPPVLRALTLVPAPATAPVAVPAPLALLDADARRTDEELARRGAAGIDALFRRHHEALYRYCVSVLRRPEEASDAAQSAWMRAFIALSEPAAAVLKVRPWLYAIARNECLDRLRGGRAAVQLDVAELELPGGTSPEEEVERRDELQALLGDLHTLSERQRSAIVLREMAGLGGEELAEALGTSEPRALGLVADARRTLIERRSGRALPCHVAQGELSRLRRRSGRLTAHLESCPPCQTFERRRRGRALSSLALGPWFLVRGLVERLAALGAPPPDGAVVKSLVAVALAAGTVAAAAPAPHGERDARAAAPRAAAARPAVPARATGAGAGAAAVRATPARRRAVTAAARPHRVRALRRTTAARIQRPTPAVPAATPAVPAATPAAPAAASPAPASTTRPRALVETVHELPRAVGHAVDRALAPGGGVKAAVDTLVPAVAETVASVLDVPAQVTGSALGAVEAAGRQLLRRPHR